MNLETHRPSLTVIAAPNGAGKSTVAEFLIEAGSLSSFVNADDIERSLKRAPVALAPVDAGKLLLRQIRDAIDARESIAFESTMSGKSWMKTFSAARERGFEITICYVVVESADISEMRVAERVARGGHAIPHETLHRRFPRSLRMFFEVYADLADNWYFFDNSPASAHLLAMREGRHGTVKQLEGDLYERFRAKALGRG